MKREGANGEDKTRKTEHPSYDERTPPDVSGNPRPVVGRLLVGGQTWLQAGFPAGLDALESASAGVPSMGRI